MMKFFDVHVISTLIIYFFKSLLHKSSYTISWIYNIIIYIIFTIYHHFLQGAMYLAYSGTLCMKIKSQNVSHITFVHISSVYLIIFWKLHVLESKKGKSKISFTLWNFDRSINETGRMIIIWSLYFVQDLVS